jgi:NAD(P)-dependent dehydrogenase (short-subunit alcohol dehydrogenase family)
VGRLDKRTIIVVGASSGIGLSAAQVFAKEGANVTLSARRRERLEAAASEIGDRALAIPCDVSHDETCHAMVEQTVAHFGELTDVVYVAGVAKLARIANATEADWRAVFDVNVLGPTLVTQAALPHLIEAHGRALYISSITTDDNPPRPGLGLYSTTKAALNRLVECWQSEEHGVSFTRVSLGDTLATDFAAEWDPDEIMPFVKEWNTKGYLAGRYMTPEDVAAHLVGLLDGPENVPISYITPRFPVP